MERISTPTIYDFLYTEFMEPNGISTYRLAKEIHVPVSRVQEILKGSRRMTVDTSIRLAKYFGVSDLFFMRIQTDIDYRNAKIALEKELDKIKPLNQMNAN